MRQATPIRRRNAAMQTCTFHCNRSHKSYSVSMNIDLARQSDDPATEAEELSGLIGEIYDTVLKPLTWPGVLHHLARFVGGSAASLFTKSDNGRSGQTFYQDGNIPLDYEQAYFDRYIKLDPSAIGPFCFDIGEPFSTQDLVDYTEFTQSRFYREWAQPQGLVDFLAVAIDKSSVEIALFGVFRHARQGLADAAMRRRMILTVPHVRRAVLLGRTLASKTADAAAFSDIFDGLVAGVLLLDAKGRLVHANAAGLALIAANDIVRVRGGRLVPADTALRQNLQDVLAALDKGILAGLSAMAVRAAGGDYYSAQILPLASGAGRQIGSRHNAAVALFIQVALLKTRAPAEIIARTWKLTPSELRVLLAIVEVGGVPEVALALGIAETTAKTHLGHLYAKTGTGRQADLVKLLAAFTNPLRIGGSN